MPRINGQLIVYLVAGVALLLVGWNSIRGEQSQSEQPGSVATGRSGGVGEPGEGEFAITGGSRKLVVDVSGEVRRPGVYRFDHGARVLDAITRAGGPTGQAFVGAINRAATLSDGQQVVVPGSTGVPGATVAGGGSTIAEVPEVPVSLGTASQEQLEEIEGIGPVTAHKILEFREGQGGIGSVDELDQISGIGPVTMESLRTALTP